MGKRQIGEMQPFEFVITLVMADLACTPMQDISVPMLYGLVPVFVIFVLHYLFTLLSTKSIGFRKLMNGKPVIVIGEGGIDIEALKKLNMNVNDLLAGIRSYEYFSIEQVRFAIVETTGKLSVLPNEDAPVPDSVPLSLVVEGKYIDANLAVSNTTKDEIDGFLAQKGLKLRDIVLLTAESGRILVQPKSGAYFVAAREGA